ncbi:MAG: hypothetical protein RL885_09850 [Planctomycetota bacterium]
MKLFLAHGWWDVLLQPHVLTTLVAVVAIISITTVTLVRMSHRHQERLAGLEDGDRDRLSA